MTTELFSYLPDFYVAILEMRTVIEEENRSFEEAKAFFPLLQPESLVMTANATRIAEWEALLEIIPQGTLDQRRMMVEARIRGQGKVNGNRIKQIAHSFTGDLDAEIILIGTTIRVRILPPNLGEVFLFPDLERALKPLIPAHLYLVVERYYNTWQDRAAAYGAWQEMAADYQDWDEIRNRIMEV